ncbi:hypothetical protein niasHT_026445 [Heterodera trifolii]|uniref:PH domain-containing protein n=1 Tax=Heterodera trifolii TaxID=157864 RepID=A0ABD2KJ78_9BILA
MSVVSSIASQRPMAPPQSPDEAKAGEGRTAAAGETGGRIDARPSAAVSPSAPSAAAVPSSSSSPPSSTTFPPPLSSSNGVILRQRPPAIPPKPQLDVVRFSMAQAKDEVDLDTILSELLELETQLCGEAGDRLLLGLPSLPSGKSQQSVPSPNCHPVHKQQNSVLCSAPIEHLAKRVQFQSFDKTDSSASSSSSNSTAIRFPHGDATEFCASPDTDSAFGDSSSTESAHQPHIPGGRAVQSGQTIRNLDFLRVDSFRGSLATPSVQISPNGIDGSSAPDSNFGSAGPRPPSSAASYSSAQDEQKAQKIREALEKMKEAKMKKVFVKIFLEDGSQRGLLIDERWTVAETMRQLADKMNVQLTPEHAIVEEYPHLHIKRVYEDHENVVENLEDWTSESPNKLHFVRQPQKWSLFRHPQHFLITDRNRNNDFPPVESIGEWDTEQKQRLLNAFLREDGGTRVPELEGWLMLKADGKKSWRRHFFVLRSSGLYYVPKSGKPRGPARDLHCLMSVFNNQVYMCTDWRKKYKAPTEFGFAIKHPRIQLKTSKYIKYICCDDEFTFRQWLTALRITKNGCPALYKDFRAAQSRGRPLVGPGSPARAEVPQVSLQRLSALDSNFATVSSASPRHRPALHLGDFAYSSFSTRASSSTPGGSSREGLISRIASPAPSMAFNVFDQDECNTIKRHPEGVGRVAEQRNQCQQSPSIGRPIGKMPTMSTATLLDTSATTNSNTAMESDSDEEQFPPPPPIDGTIGTANESHPFRAMLPPPSLPSIVCPRNLAPPPPKRSEETRLQMAEQNAFEMREAQNELMAELQQRQRMRTKESAEK